MTDTTNGIESSIQSLTLSNPHSSIDRLIISPKNLTYQYSFGKRRKVRPPPGKYWWKDPLGRDVAAGGILILDEYVIDNKSTEGIWVVVEKSRRGIGIEYSDFGGRYHYDDGDIYATISREFREETYNTDEIPYSTVKKLVTSPSDNNKFVYRMNKGKYVCLVVDRKYLPSLYLNNENVEKARIKVLRENPYISRGAYRSEGVAFLPFSDICTLYRNKLSYRLSEILKKSRLVYKINFNNEISL